MKEVIDILQQFGLSVLIILYFIFKDYKQSTEMMKLMVELRVAIEKFEKILDKKESKDVEE